MQRLLSSISECVNATACVCLAVLALSFGTAENAVAAGSSLVAKVAPKPSVDAEYLADPASWPGGSIILRIAATSSLQAADASEVKFLSTNRCFINIPVDADKKKLITLPEGFFEAAGVSPGEIYANMVDQDHAAFLAMVRSPVNDSSVGNYDCYKLTFAYAYKDPTPIPVKK